MARKSKNAIPAAIQNNLIINNNHQDNISLVSNIQSSSDESLIEPFNKRFMNSRLNTPNKSTDKRDSDKKIKPQAVVHANTDTERLISHKSTEQEAICIDSITDYRCSLCCCRKASVILPKYTCCKVLSCDSCTSHHSDDQYCPSCNKMVNPDYREFHLIVKLLVSLLLTHWNIKIEVSKYKPRFWGLFTSKKEYERITDIIEQDQYLNDLKSNVRSIKARIAELLLEDRNMILVGKLNIEEYCEAVLFYYGLKIKKDFLLCVTLINLAESA